MTWTDEDEQRYNMGRTLLDTLEAEVGSDSPPGESPRVQSRPTGHPESTVHSDKKKKRNPLTRAGPAWYLYFMNKEQNPNWSKVCETLRLARKVYEDKFGQASRIFMNSRESVESLYA